VQRNLVRRTLVIAAGVVGCVCACACVTLGTRGQGRTFANRVARAAAPGTRGLARLRWLAKLHLAPPGPTPGDRPALITGVVLDPDGVPAPGVTVLAELELEPGRARPIAVSDGAGRFSLEVPLDYGDSTSGWVKAGTTELGAATEVTLARPGERPELELQLMPRLAVEGQVLVAGQPWAGARVTAQLMGALHGRSMPPTEVRSGNDGRFRVEALGAGVFNLVAVVGAARSEAELVQALPGERIPVVIFELPALTLARARVVSSIGGGPIAGAVVNDAAGEPLGETDGAGFAQFMVPVGDDPVRVLATHPRYQTSWATVLDGEALLMMGQFGLVRGRVVAPAQGRVSIWGTAVGRGEYGHAGSTQSSTGSFEMMLAPGQWRLEAWVEGVGASVPITVTVPVGEVEAGVLLVPGQRGRVRGEVVDAVGMPRANALVVLSPMRQGGGANPHVLTGRDGGFELADLPVGDWRVTGPDHLTSSVTVASGQDSFVHLQELPPEPPLTAEEAEIEELGAETTEPYGSEDATPDLSIEYAGDDYGVVISGDLPPGLLPGDHVTEVDGHPWNTDEASLRGPNLSKVVLTGVRPANGARFRVTVVRTQLPEYEDCH